MSADCEARAFRPVEDERNVIIRGSKTGLNDEIKGLLGALPISERLVNLTLSDDIGLGWIRKRQALGHAGSQHEGVELRTNGIQVCRLR